MPSKNDNGYLKINHKKGLFYDKNSKFYENEWILLLGTPGSIYFFLELGCLVSSMHFWEAWDIPNEDLPTKKIQNQVWKVLSQKSVKFWAV